MWRVLLLFFITFAPLSVWGQNATSTEAQKTEVEISVATFNICPEPSRWGTSADYLRATARCVYGASQVAADLKRVSLIEDIFIKSWSYAVLNKICFWIAIILAILVLIWPALAGMFKPESSEDGSDEEPITKPAKISWLARATESSSMQTSITALAALSFAFYAHYKSSQMRSENLMREILYANVLDQTLINRAIIAIGEVDSGFNFSTSPPAE